ncbi:MAG: HhH-GPD-type base excision DNA repair protein [Candidatus Limnocylindrales bacterium]
MTVTLRPPERLWYTGDADADRLLARDPLALVIGFVLDQQVTVQKAFSGPHELERRLGERLDAARLAALEPSHLVALFQQRPALHRFPGSMAGRVQAVCAVIAHDYGNDAARLWTEARDGPDLRRRLMALPGVGEMKAATIMAVLARRFGLQLPGLEDVLPRRPTLGDVDSPEALADYQAGKRAYKAVLRAGGSAAEAGAAAMDAGRTTPGPS